MIEDSPMPCQVQVAFRQVQLLVMVSFCNSYGHLLMYIVKDRYPLCQLSDNNSLLDIENMDIEQSMYIYCDTILSIVQNMLYCMTF